MQYYFPNHNDPDPQKFVFIKNRLSCLFSGMELDCLWARMRTALRRQLRFYDIKFPEIVGTHFLSTSEGQTTQIPKSDPKKGLSILM